MVRVLAFGTSYTALQLQAGSIEFSNLDNDAESLIHLPNNYRSWTVGSTSEPGLGGLEIPYRIDDLQDDFREVLHVGATEEASTSDLEDSSGAGDKSQDLSSAGTLNSFQNCTQEKFHVGS
ncbi:hypothetical protein NW758_014967 [Fusarium oxysporum]|nr:hypothetical protein NW758_014967 [Fusarium oxysporum]